MNPAVADVVTATGEKTVLTSDLAAAMSDAPTAIAAHQGGFAVQLLVYCIGSPTELPDDLSIRRTERIGILPTPSMTCIEKMVREFTTKLGKRMTQTVADPTILTSGGSMDCKLVHGMKATKPRAFLRDALRSDLEFPNGRALTVWPDDFCFPRQQVTNSGEP